MLYRPPNDKPKEEAPQGYIPYFITKKNSGSEQALAAMLNNESARNQLFKTLRDFYRDFSQPSVRRLTPQQQKTIDEIFREMQKNPPRPQAVGGGGPRKPKLDDLKPISQAERKMDEWNARASAERDAQRRAIAQKALESGAYSRAKQMAGKAADYLFGSKAMELLGRIPKPVMVAGEFATRASPWVLGMDSVARTALMPVWWQMEEQKKAKEEGREPQRFVDPRVPEGTENWTTPSPFYGP